MNKNKVLQDLKSRLSNRFAENLKDVVLFGSQVSGKQRKESDFDILIILNQKPD